MEVSRILDRTEINVISAASELSFHKGSIGYVEFLWDGGIRMKIDGNPNEELTEDGENTPNAGRKSNIPRKTNL